MMKGLERSFLLDVGKMVIPFETNHLCYPLRAPGKPGKNAERGDDFQIRLQPGRGDRGCLAGWQLRAALGLAGLNGFSGREA
jgi:hypothetical protein